MDALRIDFKGLDATLAMLKGVPAQAEKDINLEFKEFGKQTVNDAVLLAPVNEGFLKRAIRFDAVPLAVTISVNVDYAAYIEFGTKSFAAAHVATLPADWQAFAAQYRGKGDGNFKDFVMILTTWVRLKGFATGKDINQAAYAIALSILRKGIRPHPYLFPAYEKNKLELIRNLKSILNAK